MANFSWEDYLADTSAEIASENLFDHVNRSYETTIRPKQYLYFELSSNKWVPAEVLIVTKLMLKIRIVELDHEVWLSLKKDTNKIKYLPDSQFSLLSGANLCRVSKLFFKYRKLFACDCIQPGYFFECEYLEDPNKIWLVEVIQNQGGLLMVSWYGDVQCENRFFIHYLNPRCHELGYSTKNKIPLIKPNNIPLVNLPNNINSLTLESDNFKYGHPLYIQKVNAHELKVGWRLEAIHPSYPYYSQPAIISRIINEKYFLVKIDDMLDEKENRNNQDSFTRKNSFVASSSSSLILPANFSFTKGIRFKSPVGWPSEQKFTWSRYLLNNEFQGNEEKISETLEKIIYDNNSCLELADKFTPCCPDDYFFKTSSCRRNFFLETIEIDPNLSANCEYNKFVGDQHNEFYLGMKLEFIHPLDSPKGKRFPIIMSGTIIRAKGRLLWILPDQQDVTFLPASISKDPNGLSPFLIDSMSTEIFPLGWSISVGYPSFNPPSFYLDPGKILSAQQVQEINTENLTTSNNTPRIFFNTTCYTGPFLKPLNLMKIPKYFGPGPIKEVIFSILSSLVKYAEKPLKILRLLEADWFSQFSSSFIKSLESLNTSSKQQNDQDLFQKFLDDSQLNAVAESRQDQMNLILLRGRCPGKKSRVITPVEIPKKLCALEEYLKQICLLLEACPNFLTLTTPNVDDKCPNFCFLRLNAKKYERLPNIKKKMQAIINSADRNYVINRKRPFSPNQNHCQLDLVPSFYRISPAQKIQTIRAVQNKSKENLRRRTRSRLDQKSRDNSPVILSQDSSPSICKMEISSSPSKASSTTSEKIKTNPLIDLVSDDSDENESNTIIIDDSDGNQTTDLEKIPNNSIHLESNPLKWSCKDILKYLKKTNCSNHLHWVKSESIDGQAFLLLNKKILRDIGLDLMQVTRLMHHVSLIRGAYIRQFCNNESDPDSFLELFKD